MLSVERSEIAPHEAIDLLMFLDAVTKNRYSGTIVIAIREMNLTF